MAGFSGYRTAWRRDARPCWPMRWKAAHDDPDAGGDADLGCLRGYRYEEGIRWPRHAGAGGAEEEPAFRAYVRFPWETGGSDQDSVVGRHRALPVREAAGTRAICLAADARGSRYPDAGAIVDAVRGHRLARAAAYRRAERCTATRRLIDWTSE